MALKIVPGGFLLNGEKKQKLIGRSSFKLANIVTYHFAGQGSGKYSLGYAKRWVEYNQRLFGEHAVLRVFLETAGWGECDGCMFGSEPRDQGFWDPRAALRDGHRETKVHRRGEQVLEWFFRNSQETGVIYELVIDATLKHDDIPKGEIDHVIRQVGVKMGELSAQYDRALIIPNVRNEWNAHNESGHSLHEVNMWAVRWERDQYWPGSQPIVCPGGADDYTYDVGPPGSGKFAMGLIHPDRQPDDRKWWDLPNINRLRSHSGGMPVGFNESMYYVEKEDEQRALNWYRNRRGWTAYWDEYRKFAEAAIDNVDYFIFHDEKGSQCDLSWPRAKTRLEEHFGDSTNPPNPPPPEPDKKPKLVLRGPDLNGVYSVHIILQDWPRVVEGIDASSAVEQKYVVDLPFPMRIYAIDSFIGLDRGDIGEFGVEVDDNRSGLQGYQRSLHKEGDLAFDANAPQYRWLHTDQLAVYVIARVTGPSTRTKVWKARPHFSAYVYGWKYTPGDYNGLVGERAGVHTEQG